MGNLLLLLPDHHTRIHGNPAWARAHGFIVGMAADPALTPITTCPGGPGRCPHQ